MRICMFLLKIGELVISYAIIGGAVVLFWRGSWGLLDAFLFPTSKMKSSVACLVIGFCLMLLCFGTRGILLWIFKPSTKTKTLPARICEICADRLWTYLLALVAVFAWRGVWIAWDVLVYPSSPVLQSLIAKLIGLTVSILMYSMRSLIAPPGITVHDDQPWTFPFSRWKLISRLMSKSDDERVDRTGVDTPVVISMPTMQPTLFTTIPLVFYYP